jgi:hypothetical protein
MSFRSVRFCQIVVVRDGQTAVGNRLLAQYQMATVLTIQFVPELREGAGRLPAGDDRQARHCVTSTVSSLIEGGTGSSRAFKRDGFGRSSTRAELRWHIGSPSANAVRSWRSVNQKCRGGPRLAI